MNEKSLRPNALVASAPRPATSHGAIAIAAAIALLLLSMLPATALAKHALAAGDRPTIVLVHGAWAGPSGWDQVVAMLHKDGYATATPTLDEATLTGDVATVRASLDAIPGKKILVAHSYGGMVISNAGYGRSDILGLVYTAGLMPEEGQTAFSVQDGWKQTDAINHLIFDPYPFAYIDPAFFPQIFCQDLSPKKAAVLNAAQRPAGLGALTEPSGPVAWHDLPVWYAISGQDRVIDPALQAFLAARADATTVRFDDASHAGGFTHYASRFVKLIEQAVAATAG
ncbi:MAG TPA: alpha/beta hydrolase [Candidatus Limnocylindrales bacterium]|nr:alpha/beta hydrolase [Candidatus Limnocylindrales bacterium]